MNNDKLINAEKIIEGKPDREKLQELVSENRMAEAFSMLKLTDKNDLKRDIILLQNKWHELQKRKRLGMLEIQAYMIENSKIISGVLEVIEKI